jgi:hypothetical protein
MPRRLAIISFSQLRSDARVLKQIALFTPDWDVTTVGYGDAPEGVADHVRLPDDAVAWRYPRALVVTHQYRRAYDRNPAVAAARAALRGRTFDVVLADDIDTAGLAVGLAPTHGVHLDLHEFAPLQHSEMLRFRLFVAPFLRWQLRTFGAAADSTTTVGAEIAARYAREFGFAPGVVTNAAPFADLQPTPVGAPIRIVHAGAALANRRLDVVLDAVDRAENVTLDLYLTPNDAQVIGAIGERAAEHPRVALHPPVPYRELIVTLNAYDLGVHILAPTNYNNLYALPNKLFDYVQARLGVIVGPSPEMAAIVHSHDLGVVSKDFTAESLADVLRGLTRDSVAEWKTHAHDSARALSAEEQVQTWRRAVEAIYAK